MSTVLAALAAIDAASLTYQEWVNIGMALQQEGYACSVWDDWSRADTARYHEGECLKKWQTFHGSASPVTGATIVQMAKEHGWSMQESGRMDWNDSIENDDLPENSYAEKQTPSEELALYLKTLFSSKDIVGYVTNDAWQNADGKWVPSRGVFTRTAGDLLGAIQKHPNDIGAVIGDWKPEAGAWIRFNALDGRGVKNENVTQFRFALVECDTIPVEAQLAAYRRLELPIACLVHSGAKSVHAIVHVDADNFDVYRQRVEFLYHYLERKGIPVDKQNRNPSRLSRMPGVTRNGVTQRLLAVNIGKSSWDTWTAYIEDSEDELPDMITLADYRDTPPKLPEELISGVLRCGHKLLISGSSKAGKSFLLMELCISLAEGRLWLGFPCKKSRVLYVNLEIDPASCINRFLKIYEALGWQKRHAEDVVIWNLRGHAVPLDKLVPKLIRRIKNQHFDAVVIDPIYKVITGDENNASDMGAFCNQFDKICNELGCAAIYSHHHSKGSQGAKRAMDRASGSGVFSRDPDAQLDMIQLDLSEDLKNNLQDGNATAWRMECSLREFQNFTPISFWFDYPIHRLDNDNLKGAFAEGSPLANLQKSSKRTSAEDRKACLENAYSICEENGAALVTDMADYTGLANKTVARYVREFDSEYTCKNGVVIRNKQNGTIRT